MGRTYHADCAGAAVAHHGGAEVRGDVPPAGLGLLRHRPRALRLLHSQQAHRGQSQEDWEGEGDRKILITTPRPLRTAQPALPVSGKS